MELLGFRELVDDVRLDQKADLRVSSVKRPAARARASGRRDKGKGGEFKIGPRTRKSIPNKQERPAPVVETPRKSGYEIVLSCERCTTTLPAPRVTYRGC